MKNIFKKAKKGFTIVELVIVIGVIGILSAILIPTFVNLNDKATKAALQSDLSAVYSQYVADAADGKVGDADGSGDALELVSQDKIAIKYGDTYYVKNDQGSWVERELESSEFAGVVTPPAEYSINNEYTIYKLVD